MRNVIVVIGPGQIGQAIARRAGVGKHLLLADMRRDNADAAAEVLQNAGYEVSVATVDVSSREAVHALVKTATALGDVTGLIHAAGVSPSQASPATVAWRVPGEPLQNPMDHFKLNVELATRKKNSRAPDEESATLC